MRRLEQDEDGTILVFVAIALAVLLGMVALSFDLGRMAATQTELQSFADNVALAAAGELDGEADAITRAQNAAAAMIADSQTFGDDGSSDRTLSGSADYVLTFLSTLPANDSNTDAPSALICTGSDCDGASAEASGRAAYVRVDVTPHELPLAFASALSVLRGGEATDAEVSATATAGFTTLVCDITPLMFCIPPGFDAETERGTTIHLVAGTGGGSDPWGPGNFGFLRPSGGLAADPAGPCKKPNGQLLTGEALERCLLAASNPISTCYQQRGVDMSPGTSAGSMAAAVNVRFDLYDATMLSFRDQAAYGPAPNVISGNVVTRTGGGPNPMCHYEPSTDTVPLPRDDCFTTTPATCGPFGDGDFSDGLANYIATNYGTAPSWFPTNPDTRYEVYLAENVANGGGAILTDREETGRAICSNHPSGDPERRVLVAAGIDCTANAINGAKEDVPVNEWVRIFLTEPGDSSGGDGLFVEVVGTAEDDGASGIIHHLVQLYR